MSDNLFEEFQEASSKMWKQKIQVDLKGADYNDALVWKSPEGIDVKPFYHPDEFNAGNIVNPNKLKSWHVGQIITVENDMKQANELLQKVPNYKVVQNTNDLNICLKMLILKMLEFQVH